ncbi:coiled-coil domain-containing protein 87 [Pseudophryne corroboree]|uniref:coiled-coil domain-containing protein 87 n=1 Tax=Pseudophryne corroboree TaxID=495146 RepID=UPI003081FD40
MGPFCSGDLTLPAFKNPSSAVSQRLATEHSPAPATQTGLRTHYSSRLMDTGNLRSPWTEKKLTSLVAEEKLDTKKLHQLYNDILQPLTLFPSQTTHTVQERKDPTEEQKYSSKDQFDLKEQVDATLCKDEVYARPVAPFMKDVCTVSPDVLCEIVKRRLHRKSAVQGGSTEVQRIFEEIILSEVRVACESITSVLCTTLLPQNKKLQLRRRIISHIMIVSEQLFMFYMHKMDRNKPHAVFSEEASLTRYKAQLLLDCSKFLNVFSVRHHLIAEIKELDGKELLHDDPNDVATEHIEETIPQYKSHYPRITMAYFLRLGRPHIAVHRVHRETELMQIGNIKGLDIEKVHMLVPRREDHSRAIRNMRCEAVTTPCPFIHEGDQETKEEYSHTKQTRFKKCVSCPNLRTGDLLADELRITFNQYAAECPETAGTFETVKVKNDPVSDDLRRLMQDSTLQKSRQVQCPDEEIPPLIRALGPGNRNAAKRLEMEALSQELNMKSEQHKEPQKTLPGRHPQTSTIDVQIPNRPLVRKADVQASDRIYTDITDIPTYPPVYNDFTSEIDAATVKKLDRNLYVGQELQEVYAELIKNISTDHLRFHQDLENETYATKVDFSVCVASSTLTKKTNQRVINKELDSLISRDKCESLIHHIPVDKEASRVCNSWLNWKKSVVNTNDYMTYISSQALDYLKVIFHLYSSNSEEEEQANIALKKKQDEQKRQRDKKIAELRAEKQRYLPGLWNSNSIMLGGLGSDPPIQDVEFEKKESINILSEAETSTYEVLQKKINSIWSALNVPEGQRLDMAIKYSSNDYRDRLPEAITMWEEAVRLIKGREKILAELEMFERTASDPNRFFHRGYEGTSMARMEESRKRQTLHKQITGFEHDLTKLLQVIKKTLNDTVSFNGRPYIEKIKWDKTEMLYWLQQDRRKSLMEMDIKKENTLVKLEPLNPVI